MFGKIIFTYKAFLHGERPMHIADIIRGAVEVMVPQHLDHHFVFLKGVKLPLLNKGLVARKIVEGVS